MFRRFPEIEPYEHGMLDVGDRQRVYWETCGNPNGKPAVVLHGGPGSGRTVGMRRAFDPGAYRIVLLDQRGAGRSTPRVAHHTDLGTNTTDHLVGDLERLRQHLGIERWLVWGVSWGTTLALTYAERHPRCVSELVLASITLTRPADIHWLYHETGRFFPEQWERFREGIPEPERNGDLVAAYYRLLNAQPDAKVRRRAAKRWCDWEDVVQSLEADWVPNARYSDPAFRITFARIVTHYFHHHAWLAHDELLQNAHLLTGTPGVLVHGRMDLGSPVDVAWELAQAWPDAELHLVDTGHGGGEEMMAHLLEATNRFASQT
ncbi:MAG: prolyl aminopeptidase [Actinomycetota bacterium]|nr:prolyl aminopeptidase [Actinomycetota bacterium]